MTRTVKLTETAQLRLEKLLEYLETHWSEKVKNEFISKLDKRIEQVRIRPNLFPTSSIKAGLYKCVVTKQTTFYYTHTKSEVVILTIIDNRQDPKKVGNQIKGSKT